jgi:hypothetical protein
MKTTTATKILRENLFNRPIDERPEHGQMGQRLFHQSTRRPQ